MPVQESQSVSQSVRRMTNLQVWKVFFLLYLRSRVFLCVATADIACLSLAKGSGEL